MLSGCTPARPPPPASSSVPPGNRSAEQPPISVSSIVRTEADRRHVRQEISPGLRKPRRRPQTDRARSSASPRSTASTRSTSSARIVGEHTYNVDVLDNLQTYYVKALAYVHLDVRFGYGREPLKTFLRTACSSPTARRPRTTTTLWSCREEVWRVDLPGSCASTASPYPDDRFERVFFQPFFAGQTFGLGQLSPLAALMVSDLVHAGERPAAAST